MDANTGKRVFVAYEEADKVARAMRAKHNEAFRPVKVAGGWVVGGVHMKDKTPYKRVKSLRDIRALFDELAENVTEDAVDAYANEIQATTTPSEVKGEGEGWTLESYGILIGRQLGMSNDKEYLALNLRKDRETLRIQMGGAFSRHIPLVAVQAKSLIGRAIVWHTWNSSGNPTQWASNQWFYMIEPVDASYLPPASSATSKNADVEQAGRDDAGEA